MEVDIMGRPVDALKAVNNARNKINPEYGLSIKNAIDIKKSGQDDWLETINNAFIFGYVQGAKAQKKGRAYHD